MRTEDLSEMWMDHVTATGIRPNTIDSYRVAVVRFLNFVKQRRVTKDLVREWHTDMLKQGCKKSYARLLRRIIQRMYRWCLDNELVKENPVLAIKFPTVAYTPRPAITLEEHERILRVADAHVETDVWPYAIRCAWETGLRMSDVACLKWSNVLWNDGGIRLTPMKTQRLGKVVEIPINDEFMGFLTIEHLKVGRPADGYISAEMASHYFSCRSFYCNQFRRDIAGKAGVFGKTFHAYRHGAITRWVAQGVPVAIIATMSGQTVAQVMCYCHITLADKRKAMGFSSKYDHINSI